MISNVADDTTRPPRRMLRDATPAELFGAIPQLADLVKLRPRPDEDGWGFLARLRASTTPEEAVTYTAFAALPGAAAGWGYECLRLMADHLQPQERQMMQRIATWLAEPTTRRCTEAEIRLLNACLPRGFPRSTGSRRRWAR